MRLLFLALAIIQLFSINIGYSMDDDPEMNLRGTRQRFQPNRHTRQDDQEQRDEPGNEERYWVTRIITEACNKLGPSLPIIVYLLFRFMSECPGNCPID